MGSGVLGFWGSRVSGVQGVSGFLGFWLSGVLGFRVLGFQGPKAKNTFVKSQARTDGPRTPPCGRTQGPRFHGPQREEGGERGLIQLKRQNQDKNCLQCHSTKASEQLKNSLPDATFPMQLRGDQADQRLHPADEELLARAPAATKTNLSIPFSRLCQCHVSAS